MVTTNTSQLSIDLHDVRKSYGSKIHALRGVSMQVHPGEVFGLLGPNGAGKSTLVKILMTVVKPTKATGTLMGHALGDKEGLRKVGYLPEHHRFPDYLTGAQVLDYFGALGDVPRDVRKKRIPELLELVSMREWGTTRVTKYSKGMRQRIGIAQALMNDPDLVLLDEPTDGVDPVGRKEIRDVLTRLKSQGKCVFLNSHLLTELEMVCDRLAIMVQGQVVRQGTIDELTTGRHQYLIDIDTTDPAVAAHAYRTALEDAYLEPAGPEGSPPTVQGTLKTGEEFHLVGTQLQLATANPIRVQSVIDELRANAYIIRSVRQHRPSLEDLFMEAVTDTSGELAKPGAARSSPPTKNTTPPPYPGQQKKAVNP